MTSRQMYEALLIELNKTDAPNILLEDFNYFANKAIYQYINKRYNIYDINQQTTDDLRVLKATARLTPTPVNQNIYEGLTNASLATYECILPSDYLHMLNCICVYEVQKTYKCYNKHDKWRAAAKRLTADAYSQVLDNFWNRPTYKKPYYYIHNVNKTTLIPTNSDTDSEISISGGSPDPSPTPTGRYTIIPITRKMDNIGVFTDRSWFSYIPPASYNSQSLSQYQDCFKDVNLNYIVLSQSKIAEITPDISNIGNTFIVNNLDRTNGQDVSVLKYIGMGLANNYYTFEYSKTNHDAYYRTSSGEYYKCSDSYTNAALYNKVTDTALISELNAQWNNQPTTNSSSTYSNSDTTDTDITRDGYIVNTTANNLFTTVNTKNNINISNIERGGQIRYGNASQVRMEIRYGTDNSIFRLVGVLVDYIKAPQHIRLTQEQLDWTEDTSQMLEYPDYVCQEIVNELVHIVMENIGDPKLQTHPIVSQSIANPAQQQTEPVAQAT